MLLSQPHTQIAVLTDNPIPVVTPLLDGQIACSHLVLLVTRQHKDHLPALREFLTTKQIDITVIKLKTDLQVITPLLDPFAEENVVFNLTEGRAGITGSLLLWANQHNKPAFWLNNHKDRLRFLLPEQHAPLALEDNIDIQGFLAVKGITAEFEYHLAKNAVMQADQALNRALVVLGMKWAKLPESYDTALQSMNRIAQRMHGNRGYIDKYLPRQRELFDDLTSAGLLVWEDEYRFRFIHKTAKRFLCGFWLEYGCFGLLHHELKKREDFQDIALGMRFTRSHDGEDLLNEMDVVLLLNNRLFLIECKSGFRVTENESASKTIYQLDSLADLLGDSCHGILLTRKRTSELAYSRAAERGIGIYGGERITQLADDICTITDGAYL
ncbi:Card1-like endonuclease domain-containing protein [Vibrio sinaloensis]|uniref:Card1-like endonuclease domain-containing protein n=1 Tax=Photobacterium sp. (strain ATCC 43367) TaxID=379097 RepID=UPI000907B155|nr:DUF1887 family CARF protein [Vibrio sinaloensis]